MKGRFALCVLILVTLLVGIGIPGYAASPTQEPTPPGTQAQADALLSECDIHYNQSDFQEALEACQAALPLYRGLDNRAGEAMTLNVIGAIYDALSDYKQALPCYQQALSIWREIGDQAGEATTLINIGAVYHYLSDYQQALAYYQQALSIWQEIRDRQGEARTLNNIGVVYYALSDYEQAPVYYQQALDIFREIGDWAGEARMLSNIGGIYHALSDYEQALAYLQQALDIRQEISDRTGEATTLHNIGAVYHDLSDYEQALAYFQQALLTQKEIGDRTGEATTLNNIGLAYHGLSDYQQALICCQQALSIEREIGNQAGEATTLYSIGRIYRALSDYEQALAYFQQALDIRQEIGDRAGEATTLNGIGAAYFALSDYRWALAYSQQALPIQREIGDRAGEARTLNNIGVIYGALSDYDLALAYYQQALPIFREIGNRAGEATTLHAIGSVYHALSDYEQALTYYQQALDIRREIGDQAGEATTLGNLAAVYEAQGQEEQALEYDLQAIDILESILGELKVEALQTAFAASTASYYHHAVRLLLSQGREAEAFHYAERGRARTLLTLLGNQRVSPKGSEAPDLIQREAQLRGELAALERQLQEELSKPKDQQSEQILTHIRANLEARRQEYEELLTQLQMTNPEYAALVSISSLALKEAQALLQEQAPTVTLISYFVGEEETVIFVIGPEIFHTEVVTVTQEELRRQTEALLAQMKAQPLLPDAWQEPAQALYEWLIAPVQEHLPPANLDTPSRLGIIPHDLLHYLPFGLLHDGESTPMNGYTLFYAPSVSSLRFIFEKRHSQADTLLALANHDAPGASHLRYAVEEAQAVTALYGTQPFIGSEATEGLFKARAGEYGLVHIAAHSDYNPQSPFFSAILLAGDESEDGRLETHEVFNLNLPQTDLVVLSACQTHLGEWSAGDELLGLERAFIRAGSPSLLTTLWPVDDAATAELMEWFYIHLRAGLPKAEALRLAQMETRAEHPEPYYWAGFVLVGDAGMSSEAALTPQPTPTKTMVPSRTAPPEITPTLQSTPTESKGGWGLCVGMAMLLAAAVGIIIWRQRRRDLR